MDVAYSLQERALAVRDSMPALVEEIDRRVEAAKRRILENATEMEVQQRPERSMENLVPFRPHEKQATRL